jgi:hypothetical protein
MVSTRRQPLLQAALLGNIPTSGVIIMVHVTRCLVVTVSLVRLYIYVECREEILVIINSCFVRVQSVRAYVSR